MRSPGKSLQMGSVTQTLLGPVVALALLFSPLAALALTASGTVVDDQAQPLEGATVRIQTRPAFVLSGPDGTFTFSDPNLPFDAQNPPTLTAALEGYIIDSTNLQSDGQTGIELELEINPADDPEFTFSTPTFCQGCHLDAMSTDFRASRHANAGRNTWVAAMLQEFRGRNPNHSGFCADCHTPGAFVGTKEPGASDLSNPNTVDLLAMDPNAASSPRRHGVHCLTCHRVTSVNEDSKAINFDGGATVSRAPNPLHVFGPYDDVSEMRPSPLKLYTESRFCAPCHEYQRPIESGFPVAVPGQSTFSEWRRWQERLPKDSPLKDVATCQHCHMPAKTAGKDPIEACDTAPPDRDPAFQPVRTHTFAGTVMGPGTLLPDGRASMLDGAAELDLEVLRVAADEVSVSVQLTNKTAGHKLPTGIDIRNMLVLAEARDAQGRSLAAVANRSELLPYWAGQGQGPENDAGKPGKGYAKILSRSLENFDDPEFQRVTFAEAVCEALDNRIEGGFSDTSSYVFKLLPDSTGPIQVVARAVWRRTWTDFPERYGLPRTDVLGNPLAEFEMARARTSFELAPSFTPPSGTIDLDFQQDAAGTALNDDPINFAFESYGLFLSSATSPRENCTETDGNAYAVDAGGGDRVLSPGTSATHNECNGGVLRLEFSPPVGQVSLEVQTQTTGAGFELRAFDVEGREVTVERVYDEPFNCELHPVQAPFTIRLDHHGISKIEARGVTDLESDESVLWTVRRLTYRFDSARVQQVGPIATPTQTPVVSTPTATPTQGPSSPVIAFASAGSAQVEVSGVLPPGSRIEIRTRDALDRLVVLGAGTSGEDGTAVIRLLRPLVADEEIFAINLRTLEEGSATVIGPLLTASAWWVLLVVLLGTAALLARRRPAVTSA